MFNMKLCALLLYSGLLCLQSPFRKAKNIHIASERNILVISTLVIDIFKV